MQATRRLSDKRKYRSFSPKRKGVSAPKINGYYSKRRRTSEFDSTRTCDKGVILPHNHEEASDSFLEQRKALMFKIGKVLGSGMIGIACMCQHNGDGKILKCLKHMSYAKIKEKKLFRNVKEEVLIMYDLIGVKGVCQLEQVIINPGRDVTLVLPFFALTDLWNFMKVRPGKHLTEEQARHVFYQLVDTFIGIHALNIMHRDIKPENIFVKNKDLEVCLGDFGLATRTGPYPEYERQRVGYAGTPCYYSYEIVMKKPYDERVDIWCLGVLLFEMLFGQLPFHHDPYDSRDYTASVGSLKFTFPEKSNVSVMAKSVIKSILVPQEKRLSLVELKQLPWRTKSFAYDSSAESEEFFA